MKKFDIDFSQAPGVPHIVVLVPEGAESPADQVHNYLSNRGVKVERRRGGLSIGRHVATPEVVVDEYRVSP